MILAAIIMAYAAALTAASNVRLGIWIVRRWLK